MTEEIQFRVIVGLVGCFLVVLALAADWWEWHEVGDN